MRENIFGNYLKEIRKKHEKTQQQLATAIGRHKMLISGMEKGNNSPPRPEDIEKLVVALELTQEERLEFIDKAALHKNTIPDDILTFLLSEPRMRQFVRLAQQYGMAEEKYELIEKIVRGE
ncbi:MAG: Helix-turn-helix domain [Oscillospiraceae bacterium]|nr:Helix-turn-helix domain [Oscillospiraceae bacterium]